MLNMEDKDKIYDRQQSWKELKDIGEKNYPKIKLSKDDEILFKEFIEKDFPKIDISLIYSDEYGRKHLLTDKEYEKYRIKVLTTPLP